MTHRLLHAPTVAIYLALVLTTAAAAGAANFTVTATGDGYYVTPSFNPSTLTIHVGDTVTFMNSTSGYVGMHNVHADDESFRCSDSCSAPNNQPSTNAWSFPITFNQAKSLNYHCDHHGNYNLVGMSGTITVLAGGSPGNLAFSSAAYGTLNSAASASIAVNRGGGASGAVSVQYATSDGTAHAGADYTAASGMLNWSDGDSSTKSFSVPIVQGTAGGTVNLTLSSPGGGATLGSPSTAVLTIQSPQAACVAGPQTLCLGANGRFQVQVSFVASNQSGMATAVPLASNPDSGLFYFFQASNIEMLIKVLNACGGGFDHYWVFFAATTNVQFTVTVTDTMTGKVQTYFNPLNHAAAPVQDTSAFATCP